MRENYVTVRLLDAPCFLDKDYSYAVPEELADRVRPGSFVTVPSGGGNRRRLALCTGSAERNPALKVIKSVDSVTTPRIFLSGEMLGLVSFLREQTLCTTRDAVHAMIPSGALSSLSERYRASGKPVGDARRLSVGEAVLLSYLEEHGETSAAALCRRFGAGTDESLKKLARMGLAVRELAVRDAMTEKETVTFSRVPGAALPARLGEKQKR